MGSGVSKNYDQINPIFNIGIWKVHSAIHRLSGEEASLWLLDEQQINEKCKIKTDREQIINNCTQSINTLRKIRHPSFLKINDASFTSGSIGFAAEPVFSSLLHERSLKPIEIAYIGDQLISAIQFLHERANLAILDINPYNICITQSLSIKICSLACSSLISGDPNTGSFTPSYGKWINLPSFPAINFAAPEIIYNHSLLTPAVDVFSLVTVIISCYLQRQLFAAQNAAEYISRINNLNSSNSSFASFSSLDIVSNEELILFQNALSTDPQKRPLLRDLSNSVSEPVKDLRALEQLPTFHPAQRFEYYKHLCKTGLSHYSDRILQFCFLPILLNEVSADSRFGPACIPLILQAGSSYPRKNFYEKVFTPISSLLTKTDPPELALSVLSSMDILVDRLEPYLHWDTLWPIFSSTLSSKDIRLRRLSSSKLPNFISQLAMNKSHIYSVVFPLLLKSLENETDSEAAACFVFSIASCANHIEIEELIKSVFPLLLNVYSIMPSPLLADAISDFITGLKLIPEVAVKKGIPIAAKIFADKLTPIETQQKMADYISASLESFKYQKGLVDVKRTVISNTTNHYETNSSNNYNNNNFNNNNYNNNNDNQDSEYQVMSSQNGNVSGNGMQQGRPKIKTTKKIVKVTKTKQSTNTENQINEKQEIKEIKQDFSNEIPDDFWDD